MSGCKSCHLLVGYDDFRVLVLVMLLMMISGFMVIVHIT